MNALVFKVDILPLYSERLSPSATGVNKDITEQAPFQWFLIECGFNPFYYIRFIKLCLLRIGDWLFCFFGRIIGYDHLFSATERTDEIS